MLAVFGDEKNDVEMFRLTDEVYTVENAVPELTQIAAGIIRANTKDDVARWLAENANVL